MARKRNRNPPNAVLPAAAESVASHPQTLDEAPQPRPEVELITRAIGRGRAAPLPKSIAVIEILGVAGIAIVATASLFITPMAAVDMLPICLGYMWAGVGLTFATSALRQWWRKPLPALVFALGHWMAMVAMTVAASCALAAVMRVVLVSMRLTSG